MFIYFSQFILEIYIYIYRLQSYSEMPQILNAIVYPSLIPGPYPESLTRNKCHLMEALYGVVPYKAYKADLSLEGGFVGKGPGTSEG